MSVTLHLTPLSITPDFHSELKCHILSKTLTLTHLIIHHHNLNDTHLNSYSAPSDPLEIGPELTMDYPFIRCSAPEGAGALVRLAFEWRSRNSKIMITVDSIVHCF